MLKAFQKGKYKILTYTKTTKLSYEGQWLYVECIATTCDNPPPSRIRYSGTCSFVSSQSVMAVINIMTDVWNIPHDTYRSFEKCSHVKTPTSIMEGHYEPTWHLKTDTNVQECISHLHERSWRLHERSKHVHEYFRHLNTYRNALSTHMNVFDTWTLSTLTWILPTLYEPSRHLY